MKETEPVIHTDPEIWAACPCSSARVPLATLLDYLEAGQPLSEFLEDFPTVTREQAVAALEQHFIDAPDALCKRQLKARSRDLPAGTRWTTDAEFDAITAYFQPPSEDERLNIVRHERS